MDDAVDERRSAQRQIDAEYEENDANPVVTTPLTSILEPISAAVNASLDLEVVVDTENATQRQFIAVIDQSINTFGTNKSITNETMDSIEVIEELEDQTSVGSTPGYDIDAYQSSR